MDTAEERFRALTREIQGNQKQCSAFGIKKKKSKRFREQNKDTHLFGVNKGKTYRNRRIDIQGINGFQFFKFPESHVSSILEVQQYQ